MGGGGESAPNVLDKSRSQKLLEKRANLSSDPKVAQLLADYGTGKINMQDGLAQAKSLFAAPDKAQWLKSKKDAGVGKDALKSMDEFYKSGAGKQYRQDLNNGRGGMQYGGGAYNLKNPNNKNEGYYTKADEDAAYKAWADKEASVNQDKNLEWAYGQELDQNPYEGGMSQLMDLVTTNPLAAQRYMTDEISNNPLTKGLFGQGGLQDRLGGEEQQYSGRVKENSDAYRAFENEMKAGFGGMQDKYNSLYGDIQNPQSFALTADDNTALGNQYGDVTRQYGQMENEATQILASHGLASSGSGAAGAMFSGLLGNKNEQLRKAQSGIIGNRFNQAMQTFQMRNQVLGQQGSDLQGGYNTRGNSMNNKSLNDMNALNSARGNLTNLGALQGNLKNSMFNQNMQGREANENSLRGAAGMAMQYNQALQNQANQAFQQQQATAGPGFGEIATGVLGMGAGALTGGAGAAIGTGLGSALFGGKKSSDQSAAKVPDYEGLYNSKYSTFK